MSKSLYNYRYYCNTESTFLTTWAEDDIQRCPNNVDHDYNPQSTTIIDELEQNNVKIIEESGDFTTGGHYQATSIVVNATANTTTSVDTVFPIPVGPLSLEWISKENQENDILNVIIAPDTITGAITSNVSSNSSCIFVNDTVMTYADIGYFYKLFDGVNQDNLGRCIAKHTGNNMLEFETSSVNSFSFTSPTYIQQSIKVINNFTIGPAGRTTLGESKIGATYVPANTIIRTSYTNNSANTDKTFIAIIEHLY